MSQRELFHGSMPMYGINDKTQIPSKKAVHPSFPYWKHGMLLEENITFNYTHTDVLKLLGIRASMDSELKVNYRFRYRHMPLKLHSGIKENNSLYRIIWEKIPRYVENFQGAGIDRQYMDSDVAQYINCNGCNKTDDLDFWSSVLVHFPHPHMFFLFYHHL